MAIAAPAVVVAVVWAGTGTPGYSGWSDTVSLLASPGQPWALVIRAAIVIYSVLLVAAATAIARECNVQRVLLRVGGLALAVTGLACKDLPGTAQTPASAVHVYASVTAGAALTVAIAMSAMHDRRGSGAALAAVCAGITVAASVVFPFQWGGAYYGAIERVLLIAPLVWLTCRGVAIASPATRSRQPTRQTRGQQVVS